MSSEPAANRASPPRQSRAWLWYFVLLAVLSVLSVGALAWYNLAQQLRPEKLAEAHELWNKNAPKNYDLEYSVDGSTKNSYFVRVRNGDVTSVSCNKVELPREQHIHHTMDAIFSQIEDFVEQDAKPNRPATFKIAVFDAKTGYVRKFVRRVKGSQERVEIQAKLVVAGDAPKSK